VAEHLAVRRSVGLFDVSHMGEIEVAGPQALDLVELATTNRAASLQDGQAQYSGLLNERGGFIDDLLVHRFSDERFFLCVSLPRFRNAIWGRFGVAATDSAH
jgi:aminomethyltransferase